MGKWRTAIARSMCWTIFFPIFTANAGTKRNVPHLLQAQQAPVCLRSISETLQFRKFHGIFTKSTVSRRVCWSYTLLWGSDSHRIFFIKGKIFYVNQNMSCEVQNVIYVITCNGCGEYYIGQTGGKLRTKRTVHAQQIRDPSTRMIPLSAHLATCWHTEPKFQRFPCFKLKSESTSARLTKENYFIKSFNPMLSVT